MKNHEILSLLFQKIILIHIGSANVPFYMFMECKPWELNLKAKRHGMTGNETRPKNLAYKETPNIGAFLSLSLSLQSEVVYF